MPFRTSLISTHWAKLPIKRLTLGEFHYDKKEFFRCKTSSSTQQTVYSFYTSQKIINNRDRHVTQEQLVHTLKPDSSTIFALNAL